MKYLSFCCMFFVVVSSSYALLQVKQMVKDAKKDIEQTNKLIKQEYYKIHSLKAEYSYLSRPSRIKELSNKHLRLNYVESSRIRNMANIVQDVGVMQASIPTLEVVPVLKPTTIY